MGIANSNMAFGYRLTPDLASQILAGQRLETATTSPPVLLLPRAARLRRARRPWVGEHN